jgi:D-glycero-D-manno-heptose 1,7-bisphosphate phosphatase
MAFVILDRDGVINEDSDAFIKDPTEWNAIPRSLEAIALLTRAGFRVVVLTNQSGIARGLFDIHTLDLIHAKMSAQITDAGGNIEAILVCPHGPDEGCACRKPRTGLFANFARQFGTKLQGVPAIGDSLRDIQAARSVGADPLLVMTGKGQRTLDDNPGLDVPVFTDLYEAVRHVLER